MPYIETNLYTADGWVDIPKLAEYGCILNILIGARRIGKTYGILSYYWGAPKPLCFLRHTKAQLELLTQSDKSPWQPISRDKRIDTTLEEAHGGYSVREVLARNEKTRAPEVYGRSIAECASVFSTRGLASGTYSAIFFDEFIPESGDIIRKGAGVKLKSAIHTLSDLETGLDPSFRVWLAANANNLDSDILDEFGLIPTVEEMTMQQRELWISEDGTTLVANFFRSPVSERMAETPLGKILNTGAYGSMAFDNSFAFNNFSGVRRLPGAQLREYADGLVIGDIIIMGHKSEPRYYIRACRKRPAKVPALEVTPDLPKQLTEIFPALLILAYDDSLTFESFDTKRKFFRYINKKG